MRELADAAAAAPHGRARTAAHEAPRFRSLPAAARAFVLGVPAAAAVALGAAQLLGPRPPLDAALLGLLLLACLGSSLFAVLSPRREHHAFRPSQVFFLWGAVLLPPWAIGVLALACFATGWRVRRLPWFKAAFHMASWTLAGLAASVLAQLPGAVPMEAPTAATAAGLLGAAIAFVAIDQLLVMVAGGLAGERTLRRALGDIGDGLPLDAALTVTGACLAALWSVAPGLVALAVGPLLLVYRALWVPVLVQKARTDPKTGLYNFEYFSSEFELALAEAARADRPLSVVMVDLDHLRLVNNRCGHLAGDRLIRAVAETLSEMAAPGGIVGRFGGEEYALLLPETPLPEALELADEARRRAEELRLRDDDGLELRVTISAGVAAFPEHGETLTGLLTAADAALYDAKLGGRNRVRVALPAAARESLHASAEAGEPPALGATAERGDPLARAGAACGPAGLAEAAPSPPAGDGDGRSAPAAYLAELPLAHLERPDPEPPARGGRLVHRRAGELRRDNAELQAANRRLHALLGERQGLLTRIHRSYLATITELAHTVEAKDPYTGGHIERVAELAMRVAERLGFDETQLRAIRVGAVIHDIGKIGVPDEILLKQGVLTLPESASMRRHPEIASRMLAELELPPIVKQVVRSHHERFDGSGYPDGLMGEEIPLAARILTAVDALDAMTSDRPYRRALPLEAAKAEMQAKTGAQFCPRVVDALLEYLDEDTSLWDDRPPLALEGAGAA